MGTLLPEIKPGSLPGAGGGKIFQRLGRVASAGVRGYSARRSTACRLLIRPPADDTVGL